MKIKLFASDLDNTLIGKPDATATFRLCWESLPKDRRPLLCYSTGRLLNDTLKVIKSEGLALPDFLICGVGTTVYDFSKKQTLKAFEEIMADGWNKEAIDDIVLTHTTAKRQPLQFQNKYKSSWYLHDATPEDIKALGTLLRKAGADVNIVYSSSRDLDIIPKSANKGNALQWLIKHLDIDVSQVVVAGDTGNDSAMFLVPDINGIVVENAQPELLEATLALPKVFRATRVCADGVLEGLKHFGVIDEIPALEPGTTSGKQMEPELKQLFLGYRSILASEEDIEFLELAYEKAVEALKKNITPVGFSACSLNDNETNGTDENYRSVWARDGSIAVIGSLKLDDKDIGECQRNTLNTLLDHITPTGQLPSNVRIDSGEPDYSGVGGISSIDSGMWTIIAFYEYIEKTNDLKYMRERLGTLQRAIDWLSAHDSNNDALIEIPEAGDWTDLFGRSYNVLYDEVLWYRTNVCFGRLLELAGHTERAGDYLRWAQTIKQAVLDRFWPSTRVRLGSPHNFAETQFSLGDTSYLVAQVTPFDFNWRCDIYGNVLAFLFNILTPERAKTAFRFMWGVGINEPYPVSNLYPVVNPGDPDWRSYYTVNLLNLPNHYHNGGIWPFVGAQWVRFIHRLGLRDIALNELVKLARLNRQGVSREWEFNEWAHGKTGRPMGKAYQAWSASEFILACHDLQLEEISH